MREKSSAHQNDRESAKHVLLAPGWYSYQYHRGVAAYAQSAGWSLDASFTHTNVHYMLKNFRSLLRHYDGILCCLPSKSETGKFVQDAGLPTVDMAWQKGGVPVARVLQDNVAAGRIVADDLIKRGFQNLVFCRLKSDWANLERFKGFSDRAALEGLECLLLDWEENCAKSQLPDRVLMCSWIGKKLKELPKPMGVMAANDDFAAIVLDACQLAGLSVPEEVALIGCDNDELVCSFARIPLSSVDVGLSSQAWRASQLLDDLMSGAQPPKKPVRVPVSDLVIRQSSDILAVDNREVATALSFIWRNFSDPNLSVPAVAEVSGLSVRGLSKSFLKYVGRGVAEEIRRIRLEKARNRLEQSDCLAFEIANECGFASAKHFRQCLRRDTGLTPREYRKAKEKVVSP